MRMTFAAAVAALPFVAIGPAPIVQGAAQATLTTVLENTGKYSASYRAITLDSATDRSTIQLPVD